MPLLSFQMTVWPLGRPVGALVAVSVALSLFFLTLCLFARVNVSLQGSSHLRLRGGATAAAAPHFCRRSPLRCNSSWMWLACRHTSASQHHACSNTSASKHHQCRHTSASKHHTCSNTSASRHHQCRNTSASQHHTCSNTSASKILEARHRHTGFPPFIM